MKAFYLIYHPERKQTKIDNLIVHHDSFGGNEDPYLWNKNFLHTYCHITQLPNEIGQINFWVSADKYSEFNNLYCDCVFVIESKHFWSERNSISPDDPIVDNLQTYEHHYRWAKDGENHKLKRRRRYTLKADAERSFQPQNKLGLIDILPFLVKNGITKEELLKSIALKRGSKPFKISDDIGEKLYHFLFYQATNKIFGSYLCDKHPYADSTTSNENCC